MKLKFYRRLHRTGLSRGKLRGGFLHGWLGDCLLNKELWLLRKDPVARACFIGLLVTLSPFFGFHVLLSTLLAVIFRANLPVTFAIQWLTNVFTAPFYYLGAYLFGCRVLGIPGHHAAVIKDICDDFWDYFLLRRSYHHLPGSAEKFFGEAVWPLLLGCALLGLLSATLAYLSVKLLWRKKTPAARTGSGI
ncbi:MAG: DUF2062 domain-containing protein [Verrucomicrobiales bacterium]|jgi:uncharacterized protein (DUF2062 family)|nr:DUF2062 domain-containing protein [Verrucomicrobiales bacterium]